jgi:hypothetical protein
MANQTALRKDGRLVVHDLCDGTWRLDLRTRKWARIISAQYPPNLLDDAMAYWPDIRSLVYAGNGRQLWILDLEGSVAQGEREPTPAPGVRADDLLRPVEKMHADPGRRPTGRLAEREGTEFRELYAFDPRTEKVQKLAAGPTAFYESHLAYDRKRALFVAVAVFAKKEQPSGKFCYDPNKNAWHEIKPTNAILPHNTWFGWMQLCYDSHHDCLIGKVNERFFAFRHVAAK